MCVKPTDRDNGVGLNHGSGGRAGGEGNRGEKLGQCNSINNKIFIQRGNLMRQGQSSYLYTIKMTCAKKGIGLSNGTREGNILKVYSS